jgi:aminoglycoside/choline kinase family phosphotransferase
VTTVAGECLDDVVERAPMVDHEGKSGALLERVRLADGRRLIVKRFSPKTDLLMAVLGDAVGREYDMWSRGILDMLPPEVGHAVIDGWVDGDQTVIVMRDLGDSVLTWADRLTREQCRAMLISVAAQHRAFLGAAPDDLTPLPNLVALFAPDRMAPFVDSTNPLAALCIRGWDVFGDTVPADVVEAVFSLLADPQPLVGALQSRATTLVHGDLATVNMAFSDAGLTLLDWAMPAAAPGAFDIARFVAGCSSVVEASREQVIADYAQAAGPAYDQIAMRLSLLSAFCWLGWNKALDAAGHPDPIVRARERQDLDWWVNQARLTLDAGLL